MPTTRDNRARAEEDLPRLRLELEVLQMSYDESVAEFRAVVNEGPANTFILRNKLPLFRSEADEYFELFKRYNDALLIAGTADEFRVSGKSFKDQQKEAREMLSKAELLLEVEHQDLNELQHSVSQLSLQGGPKRKLPKLELAKFSGEIRDWLTFWNQFEVIHTDEAISNVDKFQYLLQSMVSCSVAKSIVQSFPITSANYQLAVDSLRERYGDENTLVKVYVRDLLKMVIDTACNKTTDFTTLYVKLSSQIRSLGTLGVTTDKCANIVYPLVESCLPEEILRAWQRSREYGKSTSSEEELDCLMEFLKKEVQGEETIRLAVAGFSEESQAKVVSRAQKKVSTPTAAVLVATSNRDSCIFCNKDKHSSQSCWKARKMKMSDKKLICRKTGRCYKCLEMDCSASSCTNEVKCSYCSGHHCSVMCEQKSVKGAVSKMPNKQQDNAVSSSVLSNLAGEDVLLQTVVVLVESDCGLVSARALFDSGSHRSYIRKELADELKMTPKGTKNIVHGLFGGNSTEIQQHRIFKLFLNSMDGSYRCNFDVADVTQIAAKIRQVPSGPWLQELAGKRIELSDVGSSLSQVDILIGADIVGKLLTGKRIELNSGPIAIETLLGWTLIGKCLGSQIDEPDKHLLNSENCQLIELLSLLHCQDVEKLWSLDTLGISDPVEKVNKRKQQELAMIHFQETVKMNEEGRLEVSLPWLEEKMFLPDNKRIAEKRLQTTTKKLVEQKTLEKYDQLFKLWEELGMIEKVKEAEVNSFGHYLPHRAVYNPNSLTTPIRPVFDASCKKKDAVSLNDCLEKGPNLLELIPNIIMRFRLKKFGVVADIKKAFQQISVAVSDRDYQRFLWWSDIRELKKLVVYRHRRVVFGENASPFLLAASLNYIIENASEDKKDTAKVLKNSFYVDNLVAGQDSLEKLKVFKSQAIELLSSVKFDLTGWEYGPSDEGNIVSILGMKWNTKRDTIFCTVEKKKDFSEKRTRRMVLALANSVFDPVGFTIPFVINLKVLVQESWIKGATWDSQLPEETAHKFTSLANQLKELEEIQVPRWIRPSAEKEQALSLHVFVDASKISYAAAVFLREGNYNENAVVHLVMARNRVAPLKEMSIPRLELMACLIGSRLAKSVMDALEIDMECTYWTDSSTALHWIKNEGNWGIFVRNRVNEIRGNTSLESWRHVSGENNPADLPSRGCSMEQLRESRWWEGPPWLRNKVEDWPKSLVNEDFSEINKEAKKSSSSLVNIASEESQLYEAVCQEKTFQEMIERMRTWQNEDLSKKDAEIKLLLLVQKIGFSNDKKTLKNYEVVKDHSGLLCVKTKLLYSDYDETFKLPILLPAKSPVVNAIILEIHLDNSHAPLSFLLAKLRERFAVVSPRKTIRSVLRRCATCQRFDAEKVRISEPALPQDRVHMGEVFDVTGIDLGGPLILKGNQKAWIVVFSCAVYRCVHLELVTALSTNALKSAIRRFVNRRGKPSIIYSDNGTNLVGCANELKKIDWDKVSHLKDSEKIVWKFLPVASPWYGGWYERMVGLTKNLLRRVMGKASLAKEEVITLLTDVEAVVNGRPLTYVSDCPDDLLPLTPAMFLVGNKQTTLGELDQVDGASLNKRLRYLARLRDDLRSRFQKEYLGQLNNLKQVKETGELKVGMVVLLEQDNVKRVLWPMGRITKLLEGRDGKIRRVEVKVDGKTVVRPYQRIYPLEVPFEATMGKGDENIWRIPQSAVSLLGINQKD